MINFNKSYLLFTLLLLPQFVSSNEIDSHDHENEITIQDIDLLPPDNNNEVIFKVHGIVCSFCSVGVRKKLSKLPFIDKSKYKNGVHVLIEKQTVIAAIKPDIAPDILSAYQAIKSGGYDPVKAIMKNNDGEITIYNSEGKL